MAFHKGACWDSYSTLYTLLHSSLLYLNILEFVALFMLMTAKYIYFFHLITVFSLIESCIRDIFSWIVANKLSVNPNKTEYLLFNPKHFNNPNCCININSNIILPNNFAKNLGVIFQSNMSMNEHISVTVKSCFLQLFDFHRNCPLISKVATITLANAFLHSHLDCCNSLFYGLPKYSIHHLQKIQYTTARIVICTSRFTYMTPILKSLHWLPVLYRINFKIFCVTQWAISLGEPYYLHFLLFNGLNSHSLCSSSFNPFVVACFKKVYNGIRSFSYAAPFL